MKKKIFISLSSIENKIGGVENTIKYISQEYLKNNYIVYVLHTSQYNYLRIYKKDKIIYFNCKLNKNLFLNFIKIYFILNFFKKRTNYMNLISRDLYFPIVAFFFENIFTIYIIPGIVKNEFTLFKYIIPTKNFFKNLIQKITFYCSNRLIVFSNLMFESLNLKLQRKALILYPGIDPFKFFNNPNKASFYRKKFGYKETDVVILSVGRLIKNKNFQFLIKMMTNLNSKYKLLIIGSGSLSDNLKKLIIKLNLTGQIKIIDPVENIEFYYNMANIYAFSSTYEPYGHVVAEAHVSGLPIVAFNPKNENINTAVNEIVSSNLGIYLVDQINENLFAKKIEHISSETVHKHRVCSKYFDKRSWKNFIEKLNYEFRLR